MQKLNKDISAHFSSLPYAGKAYEVWGTDAGTMRLNVISGNRVIESIFGLDNIRNYYRCVKAACVEASAYYHSERTAQRGMTARIQLRERQTPIGSPVY